VNAARDPARIVDRIEQALLARAARPGSAGGGGPAAPGDQSQGEAEGYREAAAIFRTMASGVGFACGGVCKVPLDRFLERMARLFQSRAGRPEAAGSTEDDRSRGRAEAYGEAAELVRAEAAAR
jgi:hypothetical protein